MNYNHRNDPTVIKVGQTYNGLCLLISLNDRLHDPETELIREFLRQHENSELVIIPGGGYADSSGASISHYEVRKKFATKTQWERFKHWLGRAFPQ